MAIHILNGFTCLARIPSHWRTGTVCLLVETDRGLVLVDTGLGQGDYVRKPGILRTFQVVTRVPLDPEEAVARQLPGLGYTVEDVRHVVLTHMHFDHCSGLPDFPDATVHVHRRELAAFKGLRRRCTHVAYVRRHIAHGPNFVLYEATSDRWFDFPAIRLPFEPEMWLVPLFGHTRGHCGVVVRLDGEAGNPGWLFHVADAAPFDFTTGVPPAMFRPVLGPHTPRLRAFRAAHPEVMMTTGHMWLDFFS
ncbi:MAG: MBL fold metallo-hydrolase [Anaerolineae bacterium]